MLKYNKSEKDYFNDYDIEGYKNLEMPINFGTKKKPKLSVVYFRKTAYKKFTAELFFALLVENTGLDYADEKISNIKF